MFCLVNEGITPTTVLGPDINLFRQSCITNKHMIGSNTGSNSTARATQSFNIPALLRKEVDKVSSMTSTNIGLDPGASQSLYLAV